MFCDPVKGEGVSSAPYNQGRFGNGSLLGEVRLRGLVEVTLLSGRCCSQIFDLDREPLEVVLRESAYLLDLDEDQVLRDATLLHGTSVITDLEEDLEAGKLHELTLVMSP